MAPRPLLVSFALLSSLALACTVDDEPRPTLPASNGQGGSGGGGQPSSLLGTCYQPGPGCQVLPENKCLAKIDNSGSPRKTLRLSQLRVRAPTKLSTKLVQNTIVSPAVTQFDDGCLLKDAAKGGLFNWLIDFDTSTQTLRTGGARGITDLAAGYCFLKASYSGIPVEPVTAEMNYDPATGAFSTKTPIPRLTVPIFQKRDPSDVPILLPLRNAEIVDGVLSADGNCIGRYRGEAGELDGDCDTLTNDVSSDEAFRFVNAGKIQGVMTLEEADQVKIVDLGQTLCVLLTGRAAAEKVDGSQVCEREGTALSAKVLESADSSSVEGGPKDSIGLAAEFAASAVTIQDGECE